MLGLGLLNFPSAAAEGTTTLDQVNCTGKNMTSTLINGSTTAFSTQLSVLGLGLLKLSVNGVPNTTITYSGSNVPPSSSTTGSNPYHIGTTTPSLTVSGLTISGLGAALGPLLQALGVSVAEADVADLGTNCNSVQLTP